MTDALSRGLILLSHVSKSNSPLSFGELNSHLGGISRASLSRLLSRLIELGYLYKDPQSGLYSDGYLMGQFYNEKKHVEKDMGDYIKGKYAPLMEKFCLDHNLSGIILIRQNDLLVNIYRTMAEGSPWMQEVDQVNIDPLEPWLQILAAYHPSLEKQLILHEGVQENISRIKAEGFFLDNFERRKSFRRIGFPLFDGQGQCQGVMGLGGYREDFNDQVLKLSRELLV